MRRLGIALHGIQIRIAELTKDDWPDAVTADERD
jgi:hypothetical protein